MNVLLSRDEFLNMFLPAPVEFAAVTMECVYSAALLRHFETPSHAGDLADANATVQVENPVCGDVLELKARIEDGSIRAIRFRAKGCVPAMACGSAICTLVEGKTIADALAMNSSMVIDEVGGIPPASTHAAQLAIDALRKLLRPAQ